MTGLEQVSSELVFQQKYSQQITMQNSSPAITQILSSNSVVPQTPQAVRKQAMWNRVVQDRPVLNSHEAMLGKKRGLSVEDSQFELQQKKNLKVAKDDGKPKLN